MDRIQYEEWDIKTDKNGRMHTVFRSSKYAGIEVLDDIFRKIPPSTGYAELHVTKVSRNILGDILIVLDEG